MGFELARICTELGICDYSMAVRRVRSFSAHLEIDRVLALHAQDLGSSHSMVKRKMKEKKEEKRKGRKKTNKG